MNLSTISAARELALEVPPGDPAAPVSSGAIRHCAVALVLRSRDLPERVNSLDALLRHVHDSATEVLLIKRSTRDSDRWSGHVALPGGRRDPEDVSDLATAKREALEEVGIDLDKCALYVGPLKQRYVTAYWGGKIIMLMCTYVFFVNTPEPIELILQESEVALAFWCPLTALASREAQCRFSRPVGKTAHLGRVPRLLQSYISSVIGNLEFAGIKIPKSCLDDPEAYPEMIMWGLTHSIMLDLFDIIYPDRKGTWPQLPVSSQLDTWLITELLGRKYFELSASGGMRADKAVWTLIAADKNATVSSQSTDGAPATPAQGIPASDLCSATGPQKVFVGYVRDRYFTVFKTALGIAMSVRFSLAAYVAIRIGKSLYRAIRYR